MRTDFWFVTFFLQSTLPLFHFLNSSLISFIAVHFIFNLLKHDFDLFLHVHFRFFFFDWFGQGPLLALFFVFVFSCALVQRLGIKVVSASTFEQVLFFVALIAVVLVHFVLDPLLKVSVFDGVGWYVRTVFVRSVRFQY